MSRALSYATLPDMLRYFHSMHRQSLTAMRAACTAAADAEDVQRLGQQMSSFASNLDAHHRIEDATMFAHMAKKMDISHLEKDHHELEAKLVVVSAYGKKLRKVEDFTAFERDPAGSLLESLETLVNAHEKAEEAVFSEANLKKLFNLQELARLHEH